jgi:hypothetical protein
MLFSLLFGVTNLKKSASIAGTFMAAMLEMRVFAND